MPSNCAALIENHIWKSMFSIYVYRVYIPQFPILCSKGKNTWKWLGLDWRVNDRISDCLLKHWITKGFSAEFEHFAKHFKIRRSNISHASQIISRSLKLPPDTSWLNSHPSTTSRPSWPFTQTQSLLHTQSCCMK